MSKRMLFVILISALLLAGCALNLAQVEEPPDDPAGEEPAAEEPAEEPVEEPVEEVEEPAAEEPAEEPAEAAPAAGSGFLLEDVGFATPESVRHDPVADVYLVSNINGSPNGADGNGFISQVSPDGSVLNLKWIDGEAEGVTLNAPKGMALTEAELWVTDITVVRIFDRVSGAPTVGEIAVEGAAFLNDAAAAPDGSVWVSDSGTGALYRITADRAVEQVATVDGINGVTFFNDTPLVTSGSAVYEVAADGSTTEFVPVPTGSLDGVEILRNGAVIVSSWAGSNVYAIGMGDPVELASDINGPADIGQDESRFYVLIPHFSSNKVEAVPLP